MRILLQRVKTAKVTVNEAVISQISRGLLLFVGIGRTDLEDDLKRLAVKVLNLRIFDDGNGRMNLNIIQTGGEILSVPQFTLYADMSRGNRPGFARSADPGPAVDMWKKFTDILRGEGVVVKEGDFGAHMEVELLNDGPVTVWLDSKRKEY